MKILRSIHSVNPALGGPIESVKQSSAALIGLGHEVDVVCLDSPNDSWVVDSPINIHALGPGRGKYGYSPRFSSWVKKRQKEYDAVIIQGIWQYNSFGVWRALHGTSTPYFVFPHGMLDPWFKRTYPLKHLKKLLYWPWAEYRVLRDARAVLFTSEEERRLARGSFFLYRCRERVVNYGTAVPEVDPAIAREQFYSAFPHLRDKQFVLFLGRLHEKKGCELLLRAFATNRRTDPSLNLVMAGPCPDQAYHKHLQRLADNHPVTFTGMLTGARKWGAFMSAEAFILPSHQENFGIAVVEALACGTPVLISNRINIWREIDGDSAGYVENDDLNGTERLLNRWSETGPEFRTIMKENAKECFFRRFEIRRATDSLLEVLVTAKSQ